MAKILIVEDTPDIRKFVSLLLTERGHEVIEAEDGQQAVELAAEQRPDLILMDLIIPVLSGWDATRKIKTNPGTADIPIVALTAHAMRGDRERAWEAGCDGFITKPIDDELLEHTIDQIIAERQGKKSETGMAPAEVAVAESSRRSQSKIFTIHNEHILMATADQGLAELVAGELKAQGYRVSIAERADQALALIESVPPDLIICDTELPDLSGYEVAASLKQNARLPFIPVILITAGKVDWERGLEVNADDFIVKPVDATELLVRVRTLIRLKLAVTSEANRANELACVISQMATGLVIVDAEGTVSIVNGRGLEILGVSLDEILGISINDLIDQLGPRAPDGEIMNSSEFPLKRALVKGETVSKQIIYVYTRRGQELILRFNAAPIYNEHGQKIGAVSVFEDTTDEVNTQSRLDDQKRELERANAQLHKLDQLKSRFISTVAHELRTPLTAISGLTRLLERNKEQLAPEMQDIIRRLGTNAHYLNNMINDLLDYSRLVSGREVIKLTPFSPARLIEEVRDSLLETARGRGLQLKVELAEGLPSEVISDPVKCHQVLTNLVSNAIKYTEQGEVLIKARSVPPGRFWSVDVIDTGIGIPAEELENIFDEFHQAEKRAEKRAGGTGLGLPISNRLAQLMGGRIEVESQLGQGSRFTVIWPTNVSSLIKQSRTPADQAAL